MIASRNNMSQSDRIAHARAVEARVRRTDSQVWIVEFVRNSGVKFALGNTQATATLMLEQNGRFWLKDGSDWITTTVVHATIEKLHQAVREIHSGKASLVPEPKPRNIVKTYNEACLAERIASIEAKRRRIEANRRASETTQSSHESSYESYDSNHFVGKRSQSIANDRNHGVC